MDKIPTRGKKIVAELKEKNKVKARYDAINKALYKKMDGKKFLKKPAITNEE